jgi:glycosyltransferase involved in cell wall biosynthesis
MDRIKILSLQSVAALAGSGLMNLSIIERMDRQRFETDICFLYSSGPLTSRYEKIGCRVFHLNYSGPASLVRVGIALRDLIRTGRYDIVHVYGLTANVICRIVVGLTGKGPKLATSQHSVDAHRGWLHNFLDRSTSRFVSRYISNSTAGAKMLREKVRIPEHKIRVIVNGIDVESVRGSAHIDASFARPFTIVVVAHFRNAKDYPTLIHALALLKATGRQFEALIVGDGELRDEVESLVARSGLTDVVHLLGIRSDVPAILGRSDVFVLTSIWEGMPGAIMEAMAVGLPVVATSVGGIPELVVDGVTGFLVPPQRPDLVAERIERLIDNPERGRELGLGGQRRVQTVFDLATKARELEGEYETICGAVDEYERRVTAAESSGRRLCERS